MARIAVFGATGFTGSAILNELTARGNTVIAVARHAAAIPQRPGVQVIEGSVHDQDTVTKAIAGTDAIVAALPAIDDQGTTLDVPIAMLVKVAKQAGARIGVVGAAGSLHVTEGGQTLGETPDFPDFLRPLDAAHRKTVEMLAASDSAVDWFYLSPPANFGGHAPGGRTGKYRTGKLTLVTDARGNSSISVADYAIAFADEIENPTHHREQFTVGY